jgi:hypothetical protein
VVSTSIDTMQQFTGWLVWCEALPGLFHAEAQQAPGVFLCSTNMMVLMHACALQRYIPVPVR